MATLFLQLLGPQIYSQLLSLSFIPHIQSARKACWHYLQNYAQDMIAFHLSHPIINISHLHYGPGLLTDFCPAALLCPLWCTVSIVVRVIRSGHSSTQGLSGASHFSQSKILLKVIKITKRPYMINCALLLILHITSLMPTIVSFQLTLIILASLLYLFAYLFILKLRSCSILKVLKSLLYIL